MSKIGIKINNISQGLAVAYQANTNISNWASKTHDTRVDLSNLGFPDAAGNFVQFLVSPQAQATPLYMLTFDTGGCYLCSLKASSGRVGDHVATWFYLPREADLPASQLKKLIEVVDGEVMTGGLINEQRLNDVFLREFPNRPVSPVYANSNPSAGYAVRYYGRGTDFSLDDLLGHDIYQPEYTKYKAVFLVDKGSGLFCRGADDITMHQLARTITVLPPKGDTFGFTPFVGNQPFVGPMLAYQGATLQLVWRRQGFKDVVKPVTLKSDPQYLPDLQENELRCIVPYAHFSVVDDTGRNVPNPTITIYGKPLSPASPTDVPFAELKRGVRAKVSKEGYAEAVVDYQGKPLVVELEKLTQRYEFIFPDGDKVTLSGNRSFTESPFKGYTANHDNSLVPGQNRLHKIEKSSMPGGLNLKSLLIGAAAGALLVGAAWLLLSLFGGSPKPADQASVSPEVSVEKPVKPQPKPLPEFEALEAPVWNRQALENAGFTGLWDALNTYDFDTVLKFDTDYPEIRRKMPQWKMLVESILQMKATGNALIPGKYVDAGDENITIDNYIKKIQKNTLSNKIDLSQGVSSGPTPGAKAPSAEKNQPQEVIVGSDGSQP
ncbi:MAG: hypothetical protein J5523_08960 [Muribaculaceae bacterium]|nr:hypothetical protein [Muribaculaceae bacterium]